MKDLVQKRSQLPILLTLLGALICSSANAAVWYWDPNGLSAPTSGTWDTNVAQWATTATPTASPSLWSSANAAGFIPNTFGSLSTLTINVDQSIGIAGIFNGLSTTAGVTNLIISGTGSLSINSGIMGFYTGANFNTLLRVALVGSGALQNQNSGSLFLSGNNTYSGGTFLATGSGLNFNNSSSFGTGLISNNVASTVLATPATDSSGAAFAASPITIANQMKTFNGNGTTILVGNNSAPITWSGNWSLIGAAGTAETFDQRSGTVTISGIISGSQNYIKTGNGTLVLSGNNTYSGQTSVRNGILSVSTLNSVTGGTANSSLGHPTTVANGTITLGGTTTTAGVLKYTGAGETTDRAINLGGTTGGGTIQNDGTGALVFTGVNTATVVGAKTLTLQGTSTAANSIAGPIVNSTGSTTALVKAQAGTWKLSGTNTYSGGTTVNGGILEITSTGKVVGNVTNNSGVLILDSSTSLSSSAALNLASALPSSSVNLNFSGAQVVNALYFDSVPAATGTWGSPTSGAQNTSPIFTGNGILSVLAAPVILQQPQSITCFPDSFNKSFTVVVTGDPSFTYQWKLNGVNISGANDSTYTIPVVEAGDAGTYVCAITNNYGFTNSAGAVLTVLGTNSYVNAVVADGPISYWRLGETNGTLAQDGVGGNVGTYANVTLNQPGYSLTDPDPAIGLPAGAGRSYVQVTNFTPFTFGATLPFTLEAWVNFTNVTGVQRIFSTFSGSAPSWGYAFGINGANGLRFTTSTHQDADQALSTALTPGLWYHLVCTCDAFSYHFYVNGVEVGTGTPIVNGGNTGVSVPLQLGSNPSTYPAAEQVNGRIDEVAIYSYQMSSGQIANHFNQRYGTLSPPIVSTPVASPQTNYVSLSSTIQAVAAGQALSYQWYHGVTLLVGQTSDTLVVSPLQLSDAGNYKVEVSNPAGTNTSPDVALTVLPIPTSSTNLNLTDSLVLHLPFDGNYGDISGRNNNGTNVGTTTFTSGAVGANALHYSSDSSSSSFNYVTLGVRSDLKFSSNADFTVSFWIRQPPGSTYTNLPFFTDAIGSTSHGGFAFAPYAGTGGGGWMWTIGTVTSPNAATTFPDSNLINDGNWHHLVHTASRSANCTTYLDGTQVDSQSIVVAGNTDNSNAATIGQDPTGAYPVTADADIDDLGVWRRALSPLEVSGIYLAGASNSVSFAPPVSGTPTPATLTLQQVGGQWQIVWTGTGGVLQASSDVAGTYTNVPSGTSPYTIPISSSPHLFYRLKY